MTSLDPAMGNLGYVRESADFYPTEEWVTKALVRGLRRCMYSIRLGDYVWEPAAGDGAILDVLYTEGIPTVGTDLLDYGHPDITPNKNFLAETQIPEGCGAIITNPPYNLAEEFVRHALKLSENGCCFVAMLLRHEWDCAAGRSDLFSEKSRFYAKIVLTARPRWIRGSTGSPRHNYAWYLWDTHPGGLPPKILYEGKK